MKTIVKKSIFNKKGKQITFYLKYTTSNIFISLYRKSSIDFGGENIVLSKLLKTFSCGQFNSNKGRKNSLLTAGILGRESVLFALKNNFKHIHLIVDGISVIKKILLNNILALKYRGKSLKLLSITDVTAYSYSTCKIKKDKRR